MQHRRLDFLVGHCGAILWGFRCMRRWTATFCEKNENRPLSWSGPKREGRGRLRRCLKVGRDLDERGAIIAPFLLCVYRFVSMFHQRNIACKVELTRPGVPPLESVDELLFSYRRLPRIVTSRRSRRLEPTELLGQLTLTAVTIEKIIAFPTLNGLHNDYERAA